MIELRHQDCMEFMAGLPDKAFDLAIVDPPYGMMGNTFCSGRTVDGAKQWSRIDVGGRGFSLGERPGADFFNELFRVSENQIVFGMQYFTPHLPPHQCVIVWDKMNGTNKFSDCEIAWTSFDTATRLFSRWNNCGSDGGRIHPTQKEVALYRWLLKNYAKPGQRILDTHLGSGSIAIACDLEGYSLTACEIDADYIAGARKRLADHQAQPRLFDAPKDHGTQMTMDAP